MSVDSRQLERHATDELYGIAVGAGPDADVTMVTRSWPPDIIGADRYHRLVSDLRANGKVVIADLTGPPLRAALAGGVELLNLSDEELVLERYATGNAARELIAAAQGLRAAGARRVLVSRGSAPALLIDDNADRGPVELVPPAFEALDEHGAGDSMFARPASGSREGCR